MAVLEGLGATMARQWKSVAPVSVMSNWEVESGVRMGIGENRAAAKWQEEKEWEKKKERKNL